MRWPVYKLPRGKSIETPNLVSIAEHSNPGMGFYAATLQAWAELLMAVARTERGAFHWAENQDLRLRVQATYDWDVQEKMVYARVLCRQVQANARTGTLAKLREVLGFLVEQRQPLADLGWWGIRLELEVVTSLVLQTLERNTEALVALEEALILAAPQGFVRSFVDEGEPMKRLLQQVALKGSQRGYAQELLNAFPREGQMGQAKALELAVDWVEPLSERELQVLKLLNTRFSVPEIAAEIHLAPTTVRTHVQNIYRKFGVHGRIEALQRGEELGLL